MRHYRNYNFMMNAEKQILITPHSLMGVLAIKWLILTASVLIASFLLDGIHVNGFFSALLAGAAIGFLNLSFKPLLFILTLPINIVTFGLFTFVVNAIVLKTASWLIAGFTVTGFWTAVFGAIIISIANFILAAIFKAKPADITVDTTNDAAVDMEKKGERWE